MLCEARKTERRIGYADQRRTILGAVVTARYCAWRARSRRRRRRRLRPSLRADVVQKDVPVYLDLVGQTWGSRTWRSGRASRASSRRWTSARVRSFARASCSTRSIRKPLEATLAQAKADQATAQARLAKANNDVARYTPLVAKQAVSQQELDDARADAGRRAVAGRSRARPQWRRRRSTSATRGSRRRSADWSARRT